MLESEIVDTYKLSKHCYTEISGLVRMQIVDHASTKFSLSCSVVLTAFATAYPAAIVFMNLPCGAWYQFSKFMIMDLWCKQLYKCFASCWYCVANLCWLIVWGKLTEGKLTNVSYGVAFVLPNLDEEEKPSPRYNAHIRISHKEWKRLYDCSFAKAFGRGWIWMVQGRNGFCRVWDL